MKDIKLSTQPYKGTKDFYPLDILKRNYIFEIWSKTAKEFGYEEYDTPLLEEADLYRAKSGDELANSQLYNFVDKGGREVAIRPEMTPSLARMIAAKYNELPKPIRWFNIGKYYRYEKPQRGRTREFFQLNIDVLGIDSIEAEVEIFSFINAVMEKFKAPKDTWKIYMNSRVLMDYIFKNVLKISDDLIPKVARAIDNYTKVNKNEYSEYLKDVGLNETQVNELINFINEGEIGLEKYRGVNKGADDIIEVIQRLKALGITNVQFVPYIMRGITYYTGIVIELYDIGSKDNPRALFGGGRYDDLLTMFGKEKLPAFGLGWGNVTTENYLETYKLFPEFRSDTKYYIALTSKENIFATSQLAKELRDRGINVLQQLKYIQLGKQIEIADKKGIPYVLFVEEDGGVSIKDLKSREQKRINREEIR